MYYEEKVINRVLCYRDTPKGKWIPFSAPELTGRVKIAEATLRSWNEQQETQNYFRDADAAIGF